MQATGRIAIVQEARFRLITADGRGLLLTLSRDARNNLRELLHKDVVVDYDGEPNLDSGVARWVSARS